MVGVDPRGHALGHPHQNFLLGHSQHAYLLALRLLESLRCLSGHLGVWTLAGGRALHVSEIPGLCYSSSLSYSPVAGRFEPTSGTDLSERRFSGSWRWVPLSEK